jgi:queuosine precursor transporter
VKFAAALFVYAGAMVIANLTVAAFGPAIAPVNAFLFIGLDLALRDWMHERLTRKEMALLILGAGLCTLALNPAAGRIAAASTLSFVLASMVDWATFSALRGPWLRRSFASNVAGASIDSMLFPILAFGGLPVELMAWQFVAKVSGGALWALLLSRLGRRGAVA